jgi:hypothetical protein
MFVNRSGQNEQSLERTFHRCFLPSFSSFGWEVSEEKIKMRKVNGRRMQGLKIALAPCPGLPFLTAGLPSFATRKARRTSSYKIYPPINFTYINEMMAFLRKSKFPMINIAIIITIANQNCFLLWSDVFIFGTIHYLGQGISLLINCAIPSPVFGTSLSYSPRAHVWGRFGQRNLLVWLGFAFLWVKSEV